MWAVGGSAASTFFVMLSVGGVDFKERQHPTNTHNDAVATML